MPDETPEEKAAREAREAEEKKGEQKPPWGSDEEFNPERAWKLILDLRGDNAKVKSERDELAKEKKDREDAAKSDQERLEEAKAEAERTASGAVTEVARLRVALKKGLSETQAKRLVGDSEEDLEKDADELLASFKSDDEEPEAGAPRRPRERLRPGAAPSAEPEETDPEKLAAQVPRMY